MKFITLGNPDKKSNIRINFDLVRYYEPHPKGSSVCFQSGQDEWHIIYVSEAPEEIDKLLDSK